VQIVASVRRTVQTMNIASTRVLDCVSPPLASTYAGLEFGLTTQCASFLDVTSYRIHGSDERSTTTFQDNQIWRMLLPRWKALDRKVEHTCHQW
jgi:hypothetical protein